MAEPSIDIKIEAAQPDGANSNAAARKELREQAIHAARSCAWLSGKSRSNKPRELLRKSARRLDRLERDLYKLRSGEPSDDLKWLYDNLRLVRTDVHELQDSVKFVCKLPQVRTPTEESIARPIMLGRALLTAAKNQLTEASLSSFVEAVEEVEPLRLAELWTLIPALKLVLLEILAENGQKALDAFRAEGAGAPSHEIGRIITSLRYLGEMDWKETLERLAVVHRVLCLDPAGVYPAMEFESRELYQQAIEKVAGQSDVNEIELARLAVKMAEQAKIDGSAPEALRDRLRHVGYYLIDQTGSEELLQRIGYRPSFSASVRRFFLNNPDELYIIGIEFVTLVTVVALIMHIVRSQQGIGVIVGACLLIIPATQAAVELMNYFMTSILNPRVLPKLDFSKAVDPSCATMVAIPTLLLNEKQIRGLVADLEVRYLVNRDPNIFYALLTDLPDTAEPALERDDRIDLAIQLIESLNQKYAQEPYGGFYLFHRHRVYNPRESAWMGWERKRGKLLDLNQLLRNAYDPFPVKSGDIARLPRVRYVLTLDSDTQLSRGSAQRLIGAMAHPLNRPLIDKELCIVTEGYGILQPRVGISVHSATRSRLASIYSGQTGFDIYSRATSDVYQDLYGEGIFTGKGIYDVDALREVLERRFPRNALLSHDLIEGAYARAGLVSDIEVIDDYPSHYSAYNRRRHRWLRGDWQIARWIFNRVPSESRRLVHNPISLVSRWKILDNLRRSLLEPATFLLLVAGWFWLPGGPRFWTLVTLALLFLPIYFRLLFLSLRALVNQNWIAGRAAVEDFFDSHVNIALNIAFLAHQTLVALDAIVRTIIRSTITHTRLLEWETATEAELGIKKRTPVDFYLDWISLPAICLGVCLFAKPGAAPYALPFIVTWCCSKLISNWLNRSPHSGDYHLSEREQRFLRSTALRTWRYFAEFSNEQNHSLIPDNVQEQPYRVAERLSPTNLGFLLNARQAALEFGYLTLSEFVSQTERTLETMLKLPRHLGHFVNWYNNHTLEPLEPLFVSSVDSGNLAASLWSLKHGCLNLLHEPLIRKNALDGLADHHEELNGKSGFEALPRVLMLKDSLAWLPALLQTFNNIASNAEETKAREGAWWSAEISKRIEALREEARSFIPWFLPEFEPFRRLSSLQFEMPLGALTPANAGNFYRELDRKLQALTAGAVIPNEVLALSIRLREELSECRKRIDRLVSRLRAIAAEADRLVAEMDFDVLADKRRKLLAVGYDVAAQQLNQSCYDLLASEARTATFIAVAKGEIVQDSWFRLGRQHTLCERETALVSWTGTMFEYLMPVLWMKSHPDTLLDRTVRAVVHAQEAYARDRRTPWGISEAAYSQTDQDGNYQYAAFGVPGLALNVARAGSLVISPYSSCLALLVDPATAVQNLLRMAHKKWCGRYGFFESADFTASSGHVFFPRKYVLVRCWMAHHQGMSLAAICNVLHDAAFQRWFHAEPLVQASALILQERPLRAPPIADTQPRRVLSFTRVMGKGAAAKARPA